MSNSAIVGILRALLTADTATFDAALKRSGESAKAWSKDLGKIGQDATRLGASLTKALTLPILGIGVGAAKLAIDFESSFAGVRKTVTATEAEFDAMAQSFRDLAKEIPVNVNELNRLGEAAGALGIPKAEVVDFARVMALLGVTTNVTADQAAESIAKIQNIFGAAGKDTERFASTLVALGNNGASTESQILEMATRIAGAGNTIGLTQGQVLGFASALSSVGLEAEAGGTAISRVFVDIAKAVSDGGQSLADFAKVSGMTSAQFTTAFKTDAAEAVSAFVDGLGRVKTSGGDLLKTLAALGFSEVRVRDTLLRAAGAGDLLRTSLDLQKTAWVANTALTAEAGKRFETTSAQLTLLWNRVKDVGVTIGNVLLPVIQGAITFVNGLIPTIDFLGKTFAALPVPLKLAAVGVGLVLAAAGPVIFVFGQLAIASSALTGAFTATGLASRVLSASLLGLNVAGAASWLLTLVTRLGLLSAGFVAGAGAAVLHEQALARLIEVGKDLERVDREIIIKELELATALDNTNDKQAQKLQTELKALKSGRDQALQQKARLESETRAAKAVADGAKQDLGKADALATLTEAQKKHREEIEKLRDDLTGKRLADDVRDLQAAYNLLTPAQRENLTVMAAYTAKADELGDKGARLTPQLMAMREALRQQVPEWNVASEAARRYLAEIDKVVNQTKVSFLPGLGLTQEKSFFDQFEIKTETPSKPRNLVAEIMADADEAARLSGLAWRQGLDDIAGSFVQLAQIAGGSMGEVVRSIGGGIVAINQFGKSLNLLANAPGKGVDSLSKSGAALTAFAGVMGAALSFFAIASSAINSAFGLKSMREAFALAKKEVKEIEKVLQEITKLGAIPVLRSDGKSPLKDLQDQLAGLKTAQADAADVFVKSLDTIASATQQIGIGLGATLDQAFERSTKTQLAEFDKRLEAAQGHEDEIEAIEAEREAFIKQTNAAIVANTQVEFDRIGRITLASFNAQIANGKSTVEAVQLLGPAIDTLIVSAERFGFAGSEAFNQLARWRTLTVDNAPLMEQLGGLNELMMALDHVGALTADTFADLQAQGVSAFEKLSAAGFTQRESLTQISPLLDSIIAQSKEHGWAIDDETAALIKAAEQEKLLKGQQLSTNQILQDGLGEIITLLGGELPDAWKKMAQEAKREIEGIKPAADGLSEYLRDRFSHIPLRLNWDGGMPDFSGLNGAAFSMPGGAETSPYPSFANRSLERVTREGLAMLHPGDVVGVPPGGFGAGDYGPDLKAIRLGLERLPIAVRDAVLVAGRRR